ncbi:MAG: hypothetical protein WEA82_03660 [Idiomarina sp.]
MSNFAQAVELLIKAEMEGKPKHEPLLELGPTPDYLINEAQFESLDLVVTGKVISKACFDHGIPTSVLKRLPEIIANPKSLYRSAHRDSSSVIVVTLELHRKELPIIIPVQPSREMARKRICNVVASMYGKEGPNPEVKWKKEGLHLWGP